MYLAKTPSLVKPFFKDFVWNFPTKEKILYLTFDDGPTSGITDWVLNKLKEFNAKATFFCIGTKVEQRPRLFQQILEEGHTIGNHTHNHLNGKKVSDEEYFENINMCQETIKSLHINTSSNNQIKLFRPPYGKITKSQISNLKSQYSIIMWDVLSGDFDLKISKEKCADNVLKNAKKGSIVVFHDYKKAKEKLFYALPKTLEHFSEKGFRFEAITQSRLADVGNNR
ncbi:MAG: polysaccharide deacetylase family protein [Flavobacteriales bacterium]|nr:MAG: polysaccharide deacetylase family protein [Flavobacteriales bacterium]